jgi:predicted nuclease of predicted toxin-antitoxin system
VKFLLDENLAPTLAKRLHDVFPGSVHVHECLSGSAGDLEVWDYARQNELVIVTKDSDFNERGLIFGHPPKVIWLRVGNGSTELIESVLRANIDVVRLFEVDANAVLLLR